MSKKSDKSKSADSSKLTSKSSTFDNPDFAFPVDVRKDATPIYNKAIEDKDGEKALLAAMQLSVATRQISRDSIAPIVLRYDKIASVCTSPWKEMAFLLKAKLLNEVYSSNSWNFDKRELPADELNPEPMLWSGLQFRSQINSALKSVFAQSETLSGLPIRRIAGILTEMSDAEKAGFSVLDFATYQSLNLVRNANADSSVIPFRQLGKDDSDISRSKSSFDENVGSGDTPEFSPLTTQELIDSLINADLQRGTEGEHALFRARLKKIMYDQEANSTGNSLISGYPESLLEIYPEGSVFRAPLLIALYQGGQFNTDSFENSRKLFGLLSRASNGPVTETEQAIIEGIMSQLTTPSYTLTTQGQWLPGKTSEIVIISRNVTNGNLLLVPLAATQCEGQSGDKLMNQNLRPNGKIRTLMRIIESSADKEKGNADVVQPLFGTNPSERRDTITVNPLEPGYYALVMSATEDLTGMFSGIKRSRPDIVLVSGLSVFSSDNSKIEDGRSDADRLLYVTDGRNNRPIEGAKVNFTSTVYNEKGKTSSVFTDKEGKVSVPFRQCRAIITHGSDRILWEGGKGYVYSSNESQISASILTDLALYHPGDSIQSVVVVSQCKNNNLGVAENKNFDLILRDANYKEIERKSLISDTYGRAVTTLHIPADGLTGGFSLQASDGDRIFGRATVQVAEYQAPTFRVNIDHPEVENVSSTDGNVIKLSGTVVTYSGAPVSDAKVMISINFQPWWRPWMWSRNSGGSYDVEVATDSSGRYTVILAMTSEDARNYQFGRFSASAIATIPAGETQASSSESFALGEGYTLQYAGNTDIRVVGKEITLPVRVKDMLGNPAMRQLRYEIVRLQSEENVPDYTNPVVKGEFTSPNLTLSASLLPSSLYMLRVIMPEAIKVENRDGKIIWQPDTLQTHLTVTRVDDKTPPMATPLWIPEVAYYTRPGQKELDVIVGATYKENAVYCQISDGKGTIRREWLHPKGMNMVVRVPAPKDGETVRVYFGGCHDLQSVERTVTVYPPRESKTTLFRIDTFRDRLLPGSHETWKFRLLSGWNNVSSEYGRNPKDTDNLSDSTFVRDGAVIAVLSNSALDAITPFKWKFNPWVMLDNRTLGGIDFPWLRSISSYETLVKGATVNYSTLQFIDPQFKYTGVRYQLGVMVRGVQNLSSVKIRGTGSYVSSKEATLTGSVPDMEYAMLDEAEAPVAMMASNEMKVESDDFSAKKMAGDVLEECEVQTEGSGDNLHSEEGLKELDMRSMEMPLAFFKPLLMTDKEGYATLEFEVPNFNTEWKLQLLGYDHQLNSAILSKTAIASKPIMVSTSMPRFLTTGDQTRITATVINNTDSSLLIDSRIEIFDIPSGKILAFESTGAKQIEANSTSIASITFTVPSDYSQLGVRAVSQSEKGSDGEQGVLMVLPSSTPVSDAITFYLKPGCDEKSVQLPQMTSVDKVTLNFCNNPEWLVLTALSGNIEPDSDSALVQATSLYSNAVAGGLISRNPALRAGLEKMIANEDSMLISPLQQNDGLKLKSLQSTPWVNNAESETARMHNLSSLLDRQAMENSIAKRIEALAKTNNTDGSWSWMKGMPGSEWITRQVISCLGSLRSADFLPSDKRLNAMIEKGVRYCDSEIGKDYTEIVKKYKGEYPLSSEITYLYDRQAAVRSNPSGAILEMKRDMLRRLPSEWRNLSLMDKATAAILLQKERGENNVALAKTIMNSVSQFASSSPDKGMWFDAESEGWRAPSPLWLSARCLEAYRTVFAESEAARDAISGIEQFLILSRQTSDWNLELGQAGVAAVVNSILVDADKLGIRQDAGDIELQAFLDGKPIEIAENGYVNLDPLLASGKTLTIHRHGNCPAWGGVLSQYVAPIDEVKPHDVAQLKIKKALLPIEINDGKRGVVRDTDIFRKGDRIRVTLTIETDRDMDYVLLTDRLGSWMQPADQLSEYRYSDGLWFLQETRRVDVNFYITRIPKGRYVVTYEVTAARDGRYSTGIASAQSQYYPMIMSHTGGRIVTVE